jgi:hypothetical protein
MRTAMKFTSLIWALTVTACGGGGGGGAGADCQTISPPFGTELPHVTTSGAKAAAVARAIDAILASQTPPVAPGTSYAIPVLSCGNVRARLATKGYR